MEVPTLGYVLEWDEQRVLGNVPCDGIVTPVNQVPQSLVWNWKPIKNFTARDGLTVGIFLQGLDDKCLIDYAVYV